MASLSKKCVFIVIGLLFIVIIVEIGFRIISGMFLKMDVSQATRSYNRSVQQSNVLLKAHPYLTYVNRPNQKLVLDAVDHISNKEYKRFYSTNDLGFVGTKNYALKKPKETFRIICLGGSTTANQWDSDEWHYPALLESYLNQISDRPVEVLNAGMPGWTTMESLINLSIRLIDYDPDMIIVYHAVNDLFPALRKGFSKDYAHYRNIKEKIQLAWPNYMPVISGLHGYSYLRMKMINAWGLPPSLGIMVKGQTDYTINPQGFETYKRNIQTMIDVAKGRDVETVLVYFHHRPQYSEEHEKVLIDGIRYSNRILKQLAKQDNVYFHKNNTIYRRRYFTDLVHLNKEGMDIMALGMAKFIQVNNLID